ncbi:discoidin domain-containing protein [Arthrobacter sp. ISL-72]|uniref:discoidin domain-containing protein n=1 Tax=Arthrobacter sp. ISL-72 TaxID=2819114 RepID=UPI001BE86379|nr:discoidin domain-containing protein [Arthrobacter sp. ISL-72]MBT2594584.1 discoidin domain-containing protein [Arthrobacter sp. ISL-72]
MSVVLVGLLLITGYVTVTRHHPSSAHGQHRHISVLPAAAMAAAPAPLPRLGWTASASDEETSGGNGRVSNVLDGNAGTIWHSKWTAPAVPLPHTITIDTKATQSISGFRYLPRSDHVNGRVGSFEILVSTDGTTWGNPVARGTWADSGDEKSVTFAAVPARYVRLTALTEAGNRGPWSSAAEINLLAEQTTPPSTTTQVLPRIGWTASASDEETSGGNGRASNVLDGNAGTIWHSKWTAPAVPLPHTITIDTKASQSISGFRYLPRSDHVNGRVGAYSIEVSSNGTTWSVVASGIWPDTSAEKTVNFTGVSARYVRLTAATEAGNRGPWSSAAEINLLAEQTTPPPLTIQVLTRAGWTASASDEETSGGNGRASNVLDGNPGTIWHSKWTAPAVPLPHTITIDTKAIQSISGFRYLPRWDHVNGRVGAYSVEASSNGTTWSVVTSGTWPDTIAEKTVTFTGISARYVRLTATTEAGNRGDWSSAAEINLLGLATGGTQVPADGKLGSWGPTINFPIVPAAAALLPGNRLLTWSAYAPTAFAGGTGYTQTSILDLSTGVVSQAQVANTGHDMFCPGTSLLADGKILISGGSNSSKTTLYNPETNAWTPGPDMKIPRGYQTNVTTSTGEVFTLGGSWSGGIGGKNGEVWSAAAGWRTLPNVLVNNILTDDPAGEYRSDNHAWLFAAPGGMVFHAGPSRQMNWISTAGAGSITPAGPRSDSPDAMNGDAVMYDVGKILTVGGSTAYEKTPATPGAYTIDINDGVDVARTADMAFSRAFATGVALPDGQVLVVGGQATPVPFTDTNARMSPEIWNPATGEWTALAPMAVPRTYHSVALLLPDGRVFVGGGGLCGTCTTNHLDGEIFTPPYLLNADGSERTRPTIVTAPATATAGSTIAVTTGAPVTKFSLMRMSTVTHTVNMDQRRIPLTPTATSGSTASLTLPADRGVLVPGSYLLFAVDGNGVPSVASMIKIS